MNNYITVGCENKSEIREESIERATKENTFCAEIINKGFPCKKKRRRVGALV